MSTERVAALKIILIGFLGSLVLRLLNRTLRWERVGLEGEEKWWADGSPSILLFWHGRQLLMPWIYLAHRKIKSSPGMTVLISQHNDGRMVACAMRFLGIDSVAGSSSRGGVRALHLLLEKLKNNSHIAITPDGPKGPPQILKSGVVHIAQRSGAKIHPAAFAAEKFWRFKSWDGMILPKPFSKAVLVKGAPFSIADADNSGSLEELRQQVEAQLNAVTKTADEYFQKSSLS